MRELRIEQRLMGRALPATNGYHYIDAGITASPTRRTKRICMVIITWILFARPKTRSLAKNINTSPPKQPH